MLKTLRMPRSRPWIKEEPRFLFNPLYLVLTQQFVLLSRSRLHHLAQTFNKYPQIMNAKIRPILVLFRPGLKNSNLTRSWLSRSFHIQQDAASCKNCLQVSCSITDAYNAGSRLDARRIHAYGRNDIYPNHYLT